MGKYPPRWEREDGSDGLWIDHATVVDADLQRFDGVKRLTAWDVKFPSGFLAQIPGLWWLDIRGGSAPDLAVLDGLESLRGTRVNQVRGMADLAPDEPDRVVASVVKRIGRSPVRITHSEDWLDQPR